MSRRRRYLLGSNFCTLNPDSNTTFDAVRFGPRFGLQTIRHVRNSLRAVDYDMSTSIARTEFIVQLHSYIGG